MKIHRPTSLVQIALFSMIALCASGAAAQDIPRLATGKPDFSGIWDKPRVASVETNSMGCGAGSDGCVQQGTGELRYTDLGREVMSGYKNDWTGYCLPWGYTRAMQTSYPIEIIQTGQRLAILYESNNIFHMIHPGEEMPGDLEPSWMGYSVSRWEGDTLVIETTGFNGKTYIDTGEHPQSPEMTVTEWVEYIDRDHLSYRVRWNDPLYYAEPFENNRVYVRMPEGTELYEYWCMENNKDLLEGRLPPLVEQ
jgi:hypothetical protein